MLGSRPATFRVFRASSILRLTSFRKLLQGAHDRRTRNPAEPAKWLAQRKDQKMAPEISRCINSLLTSAVNFDADAHRSRLLTGDNLYGFQRARTEESYGHFRIHHFGRRSFRCEFQHAGSHRCENRRCCAHEQQKLIWMPSIGVLNNAAAVEHIGRDFRTPCAMRL